MRLVEQTELGYPRGNCVRAAWASLLGVPLAVVPDFSPHALGDRVQIAAERAWVRTLGYDLVVVPDVAIDVPPDVCHMVSGLSPRGFGHRCVGRGGEVVWDPHPSHQGLVEVWSRAFLVPLVDPTLDVAETSELLGFCGWCS